MIDPEQQTGLLPDDEGDDEPEEWSWTYLDDGDWIDTPFTEVMSD